MTDFLEEAEKELYGLKPSERVGKYKLPLEKKKIIKEVPEEIQPEEPKKTFNFSFFINIFLYLSVALFLVSLIFVFYKIFLFPQPPKGLDLSLIGPKEVNSLEEVSYSLVVNNNSKQELENVTLKINLSKGAFYQNDLSKKEISFFIGNLEPNKSYSQKLELLFLNEGNVKEKLFLTLSYNLPGKPYTFEKTEEFLVLIKNPPLKVQTFLPEKIYVNQPFQVSFVIFNLTNKKIDNVDFIIDPPNYFFLSNSFPETNNYYWNLGELGPQEKKSVTLIGQIEKSISTGIFQTKVNFSWNNLSFDLTKEAFKVNVLDNPVVFEVIARPENESVPMGSTLFYTINIKNNSQTILKEGEVKVVFEGPFDFSSLRSNGYFDLENKTLIWNPRNKPKLLNIKPQDKININFSISLFESYPIFAQKDKDFTAKIRVEFTTPSIPIEIEPKKEKFVIFQESQKKISGRISLNHYLAYDDKLLETSGPFPLQTNVTTTLNWHVNIFTIGEDFENFTIATQFPLGVNFTGKVAGDALLENVKYDPVVGTFIYQIDKLQANLGYKERNLELVFQLAVVPPANIQKWTIIPRTQYSAKGSFSKTSFNYYLPELKEYVMVSY